MKRTLLATLVALAASHAMADTTISYAYGPNYAEGGQVHPVSKHAFGISNSQKFSLGTNTVSLTMLKSDHNDLADDGSSGVREYVLNDTFTWTLTERLGLITALEVGHENTSADPDGIKFGVGPTYALPLWGGTWRNTAILWQEWENCDKCVKGDDVEAQHHDANYRPYLTLQTAYSRDFTLGSLPATASASYLLKQKQGHGATDGTPKLEQNTALQLLVSPVAGLWVGPGYVIKNTATSPAGGNGSTFTFNAKYTF